MEKVEHGQKQRSRDKTVENLWFGNWVLMAEMRNVSTLWSVSVTRSAGELFSFTAFCFWKDVRMI